MVFFDGAAGSDNVFDDEDAGVFGDMKAAFDGHGVGAVLFAEDRAAVEVACGFIGEDDAAGSGANDEIDLVVFKALSDGFAEGGAVFSGYWRTRAAWRNCRPWRPLV